MVARDGGAGGGLRGRRTAAFRSVLVVQVVRAGGAAAQPPRPWTACEGAVAGP